MHPTEMMPASEMPDHESASKMSEAPAKPKGGGAMKVDSVTLRPAENGGVIATCSKSRADGKMDAPGPSFSSKDYAFGSVDEAVEFARAELGGGSALVEEPAPNPGPAMPPGGAAY